ATAHCVSSDTSLWNVPDVGLAHVGDHLDSAYVAQRLAALNVLSELDLRWNPVAHRRIVTYGKRRTHHLGTMLGRSAMYFPLFEEVLAREGLPLELKYLSVVESGLNPEARSPVGARGLWQFMYYTAKAEGLRIDGYVDERKDPLLATEAACRHLRRLHRMYGDWYFALAAYNAGPGNVNKAIRRSGGKTNYWEVRPFLPKETRDYVPNFIAVVYLMEHHADHGIFPQKALPGAMSVDTLMVEGPLRFDQMAAVTSLSEAEVAALNPMYRLKIVPGPGERFALRWPVEKVAEFLGEEQAMRAHKPDLTPTIKYEPEPVVYRVKSGDVLGTIARKHGVKVSQLKAWNDLKSTTIRVGQRLIIHADPNTL
ncbi:MAG: transglycosylase SLT domain-containing protein, partial [Bacteroidota bacterium]|nr:transglycosylase SLT domain-containing protein [Bacteroidota bacterium]